MQALIHTYEWIEPSKLNNKTLTEHCQLQLKAAGTTQ